MSVPPSSLICPPATVCTPVIVKSALPPISRVWLLLLSVSALAVEPAPLILSTEAEVESICSDEAP